MDRQTTANPARTLLALAVLSLGWIPAAIAAGPGECAQCRRGAVLDAVSGIHESSALAILAERLTTPCFHLQSEAVVDHYRDRANQAGWGWLVQPSLWKPPEYHLSLIYEEDLPGVFKSMMAVDLDFEDGSRVGHWDTRTENPDAGLTWHLNNMFENKDAPLRNPVQVQDRIREFERGPVACKIEPSNERVKPGTAVSGRVSECRDDQGLVPKPFHRVVLQAVEGEITDGEPNEVDPDLRVFALEDGSAEFSYRAPDTPETDTDVLRVYRGCDISDAEEYPLKRTGVHGILGESEVWLRCDDGYTFSKIAKSRDGLYLGGMNNAGQIAYYRSIPGQLRLMVSDGLRTQQLLQASSGGKHEIHDLGNLNDRGVVVYCGSKSKGRRGEYDKGIFKLEQPGSPEPVSIVDKCRAPDINNMGKVAYWAVDSQHGAGIFVDDEPMATQKQQFSMFGNVAINGLHRIAFQAHLVDNDQGIFLDRGFAVIRGWTTSRVDPVINDSAAVAFAGSNPRGEYGVWLAEEGEIKKVLGLAEDFHEDHPAYTVSMNNSGDVAAAQLDAIWVRHQRAARRVIQIGDSLGGSRINKLEIRTRSMNESGQIGLWAHFEDGRNGIYRAEPCH